VIMLVIIYIYGLILFLGQNKEDFKRLRRTMVLNYNLVFHNLTYEGVIDLETIEDQM